MEDRKQVIGITGARGLLGSELMKMEGAIELPGDVANPSTMEEWPQVDYVINCAARTDVDWCETHPELAWASNWTGVKNIINWCNRKETWIKNPCLVQISSEMALHPTNVYGLTKFSADNLVINQMKNNSVILYTSHLFGNSPSLKRTFPKWILQKMKDGVPFEVDCSLYCRPTWIRDIRSALEWAIKGGYRGSLVAVGKDYISKFDHAQLIERTKVAMIGPEYSMITRRYGFGTAQRQSVDLWEESIPRYSNMTSLEESTEIYLREEKE